MNRTWFSRSRRHFVGLRLLHLDDHLGGREYIRRAGHDLGPGPAVGRVVEPDPGAGAALDDNAMAVVGQLANAAGDETDTVLVGFHLFRNPDKHRSTSLPGPLY